MDASSLLSINLPSIFLSFASISVNLFAVGGERGESSTRIPSMDTSLTTPPSSCLHPGAVSWASRLIQAARSVNVLISSSVIEKNRIEVQ